MTPRKPPLVLGAPRTPLGSVRSSSASSNVPRPPHPPRPSATSGSPRTPLGSVRSSSASSNVPRPPRPSSTKTVEYEDLSIMQMTAKRFVVSRIHDTSFNPRGAGTLGRNLSILATEWACSADKALNRLLREIFTDGVLNFFDNSVCKGVVRGLLACNKWGVIVATEDQPKLGGLPTGRTASCNYSASFRGDRQDHEMYRLGLLSLKVDKGTARAVEAKFLSPKGRGDGQVVLFTHGEGRRGKRATRYLKKWTQKDAVAKLMKVWVSDETAPSGLHGKLRLLASAFGLHHAVSVHDWGRSQRPRPAAQKVAEGVAIMLTGGVVRVEGSLSLNQKFDGEGNGIERVVPGSEGRVLCVHAIVELHSFLQKKHAGVGPLPPSWNIRLQGGEEDGEDVSGSHGGDPGEEGGDDDGEGGGGGGSLGDEGATPAAVTDGEDVSGSHGGDPGEEGGDDDGEGGGGGGSLGDGGDVSDSHGGGTESWAVLPMLHMNAQEIAPYVVAGRAVGVSDEYVRSLLSVHAFLKAEKERTGKNRPRRGSGAVANANAGHDEKYDDIVWFCQKCKSLGGTALGNRGKWREEEGKLRAPFCCEGHGGKCRGVRYPVTSSRPASVRGDDMLTNPVVLSDRRKRARKKEKSADEASKGGGTPGAASGGRGNEPPPRKRRVFTSEDDEEEMEEERNSVKKPKRTPKRTLRLKGWSKKPKEDSEDSEEECTWDDSL